MPFTPFHMGPALVVKSIAHRHFSRPVFGVTQVGVDPAALAGHAVTGDLSNHAVPHTLGGATLVAGLVAGLILLLLRPAPDPPFRWWNRLLGARSGSVWRRGAPVPWRAARPSAPLGGWSHVLLDAATHPELTPLAPFGNANPLHLPLAVARFLTVLRRPAAGLLGVTVLRCAPAAGAMTPARGRDRRRNRATGRTPGRRTPRSGGGTASWGPGPAPYGAGAPPCPGGPPGPRPRWAAGATSSWTRRPIPN